MKYVSDEVQGQVSALEQREKYITWRLQHIFPYWICLMFGSVIALIFIGNLAPAPYPARIDVPDILSEAFGADTGEGAPRSTTRQQFLSQVEKHDVDAVESSLREVGQLSTPAGVYVLAQLSLAKDKGHSIVNADVVNQILVPEAGFTATKEALYALENAAFGHARSPVAIAYFDDAFQWLIIPSLYMLSGCLLSLFGAVLIFAMTGVRYSIHQRLARIRLLLKGLD